MKKYKSTLNLPNTKFSMKADLVLNAQKYIDLWKSIDFYEITKKENRPIFRLQDGPPYANGYLHMGHALNKVLKDFICRWKQMQGFHIEFIPGWDCHGLPIEWQIEKNNIEKYRQYTTAEKRKICLAFAKEQVEIQLNQFKQLHLLSKFDKCYFTTQHDYQIKELKILSNLIEQKLIYTSFKPVFWSWSSQSNLAESEIIYEDKEDDSIYFWFSVTSSEFKKLRLIIWTTTPYTLEANLAVVINPELKYVIFKYGHHSYVCVENKYESLIDIFNWNIRNAIIEKVILGKELAGHKYYNPITQEENILIADDYIDKDMGTGIMHSAPGNGIDDYLIGIKNNLDIYCSINEKGYFVDDCKFKEIAGFFYEDANKVIINYLDSINHLLASKKIVHSVSHDWRTKKRTFFRATKQWFLNISNIKKYISEKIKFLDAKPEWLANALNKSISNRNEWCISRQRSWGNIIPIIFKNEEPILEIEQINHIIDILDEKGIDAWYTDDIRSFLLPKYFDINMDVEKIFKKSTDILDVWFDSGCSFISQIESVSVDIYLEGFDQLRGWFNSSTIIYYSQYKELPFKKLISHGFVLDKNGLKMSKSLGNIVDPKDIVYEYGADILRLWIATNSFVEDIKITDESIKYSISLYRKIRNIIFKYSLSQMDAGVKPNLQILNNLTFLENKYINYLFCLSINKALDLWNNFDFALALKEITEFISIYSSWYLEISKDSLYCDEPNSLKNQEIKIIIFNIFSKLLIFFAPIIPQTTEEVYIYLKENLNYTENPLGDSWKKSIHLEKWISKQNPETIEEKILIRWNKFFKLKDLIYVEVEKLKIKNLIKSSIECVIYVPESLLKECSFDNLNHLLNVCEVKSTNTNDIYVEKTNFLICDRCNKFFKEIYNDVCLRCKSLLNL